jgi:hypothetical protein
MNHTFKLLTPSPQNLPRLRPEARASARQGIIVFPMRKDRAVRLALPHFATRDNDSEAVDVVLAAVAEGLGGAANRRNGPAIRPNL